MAFNVSFIIRLQDKFSKQAQKINNAMKRIEKRARQVSKSLKKVGDRLGRIGRGFSLKVTAPIAALGVFAIKAASDMETLNVGFEVLTGSVEKAKKLVGDLRTFSKRTPFELPGLAIATKKLLAAGVAAEDITGELKTLGDIAAVSNIPLSDLASIFAKIKNKNKAMTEEILQLAERGIPIIDSLAKTYGISGAAVLKAAEDGKISFAIIKKELEKMTTQGGIFEDGMVKLSQTMGGLFSTLRDNVRDSMIEIGNSLIRSFDLKQLVKDAIVQIDRFTRFFRSLSPSLQKTIFLFVLFAATVGPAITMLGFFFIGLSGLTGVVGALSVGFLALGAGGAIAFAPMLLLAAGIALIGFGIFKLITKTDILSKAFKVIDFVIGSVIKAFVFFGELLKTIGRLIGAAFIGNFIKQFGKEIDALTNKFTAFLRPIERFFELIGKKKKDRVFAPSKEDLARMKKIGELTKQAREAKEKIARKTFEQGLTPEVIENIKSFNINLSALRAQGGGGDIRGISQTAIMPGRDDTLTVVVRAQPGVPAPNVMLDTSAQGKVINDGRNVPLQ